MPPKRRRGATDGGSGSAATTEAILQVGDADVSFMQQKLVELWRQGKMCDVQLEADDGTTFGAHAIVLASGSPYFEARFTTFADDSNEPIKLKMPSVLVDAVLHYLYLGTCELQESLIVPLLEAASLLQIEPLLEAVSSEITARLSPESCVGAYDLAERHDLSSLAASAQQYLQGCFMELKADGLVAIPQPLLCAVLAADALKAANEEAIFDRVVQWHGGQKPQPTLESMLQVLKPIRYPLMASSFLKNTVMVSPLLASQQAQHLLVTSFVENRDRPTKKRLGGVQWLFVGKWLSAETTNVTPWCKLPGVEPSQARVVIKYRGGSFGNTWKEEDLKLSRHRGEWWSATNALCDVDGAKTNGYELSIWIDGELWDQIECRDMEVVDRPPVVREKVLVRYPRVESG